MSASKQKMMLPIHCASHAHFGYGTGEQCPWCEIERLRKGIQEAIDNRYSHDVFVELEKLLKPPTHQP